jgi:Xaa-Pro aminopeptidase
MSKKSVLTVFFTLIVLLSTDSVYAQKSKQRYEILRLIRHEKFDLVLPGAMRDNTVDMWIHVVESGKKDPLALDLGGWFEYRAWEPIGYYIFSDRGKDRIERTILGGEDQDGLYDIIGSGKDLREFVEERDPKVIAINMSTSLPIANGLSHTAYLKMTKALGEKYTRRLISAENVITDFRVRRIQREIIAFAKACEIQRQVMDAGLRKIQPGVTSREDVGWWAQDQLLAQGIPPSYEAATLHLPYMPGVSHSEVSDRSETRKQGYVFQRGDYISWDMGIGYLNFGTDFKRNAYILKEGETDIPKGLKHAWDRTLKAREIIRKTFKMGRTAGESLKAIVRALEAGGFVHTPSDDISSQYRDLMNALGDSDKSGFSIDFHATGNTSVGDITAGPSIAPWRKGRAHLLVQQNYIFAFEFMVHTWIPEWGKRVSISYEDNSIVTEKGVEALYPWHDTIMIIR